MLQPGRRGAAVGPLDGAGRAALVAPLAPPRGARGRRATAVQSAAPDTETARQVGRQRLRDALWGLDVL